MTVRRVVTTRAGGASRWPYGSFNLGGHVGDDPAAVEANRRRLAAELGTDTDRVVWMDQVHGTTVAVVARPPARPLPATDGVVTATEGLVLAVLVADCVPVLLADPVAGVVGAAHAGRAGAAAGVAVRVLATMVELGATAGRIEVLLGPAVCGGCYEVPAHMAEQVEAVLPGSACQTRHGSTGLDLRAGLTTQLLAHGVGSVVCDPRCTVEGADLFSYRRDGVTGRQAGLVWLTGEGGPCVY